MLFLKVTRLPVNLLLKIEQLVASIKEKDQGLKAGFELKRKPVKQGMLFPLSDFHARVTI
jgi:hypothetical protein